MGKKALEVLSEAHQKRLGGTACLSSVCPNCLNDTKIMIKKIEDLEVAKTRWSSGLFTCCPNAAGRHQNT